MTLFKNTRKAPLKIQSLKNRVEYLLVCPAKEEEEEEERIVYSSFSCDSNRLISKI